MEKGVSEWLSFCFLLYPMPNLITEGGGGLETDKKWFRNMGTAPHRIYDTNLFLEAQQQLGHRNYPR